MDRDEIREFIMQEITRQLDPFKRELSDQSKSLKDISHWKHALWSNGSGGPPGWLELFAQETRDGLKQIRDIITKLSAEETRREGVREGEESIKMDRRKTDEGKRERSKVIMQAAALFVAAVMMLVGITSLILTVRLKMGKMHIPSISLDDQRDPKEAKDINPHPISDLRYQQ